MDKVIFGSFITKFKRYQAAGYSLAAAVCYVLAGQPNAWAATDNKPVRLVPANEELEKEFNRRIAACKSRSLLDRLREKSSLQREKFSSIEPSLAMAGGDDCAAAVNMPAGAGLFTDTGNTTGANNTVTAVQAGCTDYTTQAGPDHIYRFVLPALASRQATCTIQLVTPPGTDDHSIYTLSQGGGGCPSGTANSVTNCVNGADTVFSGGGTETITDAEMDAMPAGIYYLFIDSFYPASDPDSAGPYTLNFNCNRLAVTASSVSVGGRVTTADGRGLSNVRVTMTDTEGAIRTAITSAFGYYNFDDAEAGASYVISVASKSHTFGTGSQVVTANDNLSNVDFVADGGK